MNTVGHNSCPTVFYEPESKIILFTDYFYLPRYHPDIPDCSCAILLNSSNDS